MNFFKSLISSIIGTLLALFIVFLIFLVIILNSSKKPEPYVQKNSVLTIELTGDIPDRIQENPFEEIFQKFEKDHISIAGLSKNLQKAEIDPKIKGIWLKAEFLDASWATLEDVRNMLLTFKKKSGKFIFCSTNDLGYNEQSYYVATASDSIFSPPESFFEFDGFYIQTPFIKGLFDKLGIQPEISRHGKYKSAVEPFMRKNYSEPNKIQLTAILSNISGEYLSATSKFSGKTEQQLNNMLNEAPHITAQFAYQQRLLSAIEYPDQVEDIIKKRIGLGNNDKLNTISYTKYSRVSKKSAGITSRPAPNKIAVIYAEGQIVPDVVTMSPFDETQYITYSSLKKEIDKITENKNVKAIVLRVNSPGGSGSASDMIWHLIRQTSKKLPIIASMGGVAASGGYYISMAADTIVAMPSTITGSIGVFGTKFNMQKLFNDKLGITFDVVRSNNNSDWLLPTQPFTETEQKSFEHFIDDFYQVFLKKAAESRKMSIAQVDSLAQGRVWTGQAAFNHHLVDVLGNLSTAEEIAAKKAGISEYSIITYPKPKGFFELFMNSTESKINSWFNSSNVYSNISLKKIRSYLETNPRQIQALLPVQIKIE